MSKSNALYSYTELIKDRDNFRKVDFEGINKYDNPTALYFKILFYFDEPNGLLAIDNLDLFSQNEKESNIKGLQAPFTDPPKQVDISAENQRSPRVYGAFGNTALNFLLLNNELERVELLKKFILLLSSINANSPWYFKEITGIDLALERKVFEDGEFKVEDKPRQITIKCLQDAYDDRIGTLLDLYRAVCYSYQMKKEIVPANLRKFNMGIIMFSAPIRGKGGKSGDINNALMIPFGGEDYYIPSIKMIEFRNCEFDYNSSKSAWSSMNTEDPLSPEYTISINYDDAYEERYNEVLGQVVTDFITIDTDPEGNRDSDVDMGQQVDVLYDIDRYAHSVNVRDDNYRFQLKNGGKNARNYWTDTREINVDKRTGGDLLSGAASLPIDNDKTYNPYEIGVNTPFSWEQGYRIDEMGGNGGMLGNALTSQLKNAGEKVTKAIEKFTTLPSFKGFTDENIHDRGTTQRYGIYEYLNRITGGDGIVGNIAGQALGAGMKFVKDKASGLYLGNMHGFSMSNVLSKAEQALSGDISGMIGQAIRDNTGRKNDYEGDLKGDIFPEQERSMLGAKGKVNGYPGTRTEYEQPDKKTDIFPEQERSMLGAQGNVNGYPGTKIQYKKPSEILPQHDFKRTAWLGKINEAQSIFNNI